MMTIDEFNQIEPLEVFATGVKENSPKGLFMTNDNQGKLLRWVAKKGSNNDWCIYTHWAGYSPLWISQHGDKVIAKDHILRCIPCTDEVFHLYRY